MTPPPAAEWISAGQFWNLYYSGRIVRMRRRAETGVAGVYDHYDEGMILPEERRFACSHEALAAYDYADWRFSAPITESVSRSLTKVLESPVMARETAVHWQQLEFVAKVCGEARFRRDQDYDTSRQFLVDSLSGTEVRMEEVEQQFLRRTPSQATADLYERLGDTRFLGLDRQLPLKAFGFLAPRNSVFKLMVGVMENPFEDLDTHRIALWGLGRHNHKGAIGLLVNLLNSSSSSNLSVPIEGALQYLCSGEELIPLQYENEAEYWNPIAARLPATTEAWLDRDSASVFWGKRLRAAMDPAVNEVTLRMLQADEVPAVRQAAAKRA
jgi:hypothetical protein